MKRAIEILLLFCVLAITAVHIVLVQRTYESSSSIRDNMEYKAEESNNVASKEDYVRYASGGIKGYEILQLLDGMNTESTNELNLKVIKIQNKIATNNLGNEHCFGVWGNESDNSNKGSIRDHKSAKDATNSFYINPSATYYGSLIYAKDINLNSVTTEIKNQVRNTNGDTIVGFLFKQTSAYTKYKVIIPKSFPLVADLESSKTALSSLIVETEDISTIFKSNFYQKNLGKVYAEYHKLIFMDMLYRQKDFDNKNSGNTAPINNVGNIPAAKAHKFFTDYYPTYGGYGPGYGYPDLWPYVDIIMQETNTANAFAVSSFRPSGLANLNIYVDRTLAESVKGYTSLEFTDTRNYIKGYKPSADPAVWEVKQTNSGFKFEDIDQTINQIRALTLGSYGGLNASPGKLYNELNYLQRETTNLVNYLNSYEDWSQDGQKQQRLQALNNALTSINNLQNQIRDTYTDIRTLEGYFSTLEDDNAKVPVAIGNYLGRIESAYNRDPSYYGFLATAYSDALNFGNAYNNMQSFLGGDPIVLMNNTSQDITADQYLRVCLNYFAKMTDCNALMGGATTDNDNTDILDRLKIQIEEAKTSLNSSITDGTTTMQQHGG